MNFTLRGENDSATVAQRTHKRSHLQYQEVHSLRFFFADSELNTVPRNIDLVEFDHGAINVTLSRPQPTLRPAAQLPLSGVLVFQYGCQLYL